MHYPVRMVINMLAAFIVGNKLVTVVHRPVDV